MKKRYLIILGIISAAAIISIYINLHKKPQENQMSKDQPTKSTEVKSTATESKADAPTTTGELANTLKPSSSGSANSVDSINSLSNYLNGGLVRYANPYIFFSPAISLSSTSSLVYSMEDGTTMFKQLDGIANVTSLNIIDKVIYYKPISNPNLIKSEINSHSNTILENQCGPYFIYNDWIYYVSPGDYSIKKMDLKGGSISTIKSDLSKDKTWSPENPFSLFVYNDKIYYSSMVTYGDEHNLKWKNEIYSMNLDGSELKKVLEDTFTQFTVSDNCIYYFRSNYDGTPIANLIKLNLSTNKSSVLLNSSYVGDGFINVYKGSLYFVGATENNDKIFRSGPALNLQKFDLSTMKLSDISSPIDAQGRIYILNDRIFILPLVITDRTHYLYYSIKIDGTEEKYVK